MTYHRNLKRRSRQQRTGDWLDELLAQAPKPISVPGPETDCCFDEETIAALAEDQETDLDAKTIDAHLRVCNRCFDLLVSTRQFITASRIESQRPTPRVIQFPLQRLWRGSAADDTRLPLAAADQAPARTWEMHESGNVRILASVAASGHLMISIEQDGRPLQAATVSLQQLDPAGRGTRLMHRKTDRDGQARLGLFKRFPLPPPGGQYRLAVNVPALIGRKRR